MQFQQVQNNQPTPLTPWGGFVGQRRTSDSPYVESVWEGVATSNGQHVTAADGTIDFTFLSRQGVTKLLLSGPTSKARVTTFQAGDAVVTIKLRPGVHLPLTAATALTDVDAFLPNAGQRQFWFHNNTVAFPTFDNVEAFVERLVKLSLLKRDVLVEDTLSKRLPRTSPRTIQRHFLATTGLTFSHIRQIKRAEHAKHLLGGNQTLTSIAYEAGYSNPGHMTTAFSYFLGRTPSALRSLMSQ